MKILAMYLPQYHTFKENNEWWGEGYTEWTAVKRGKPLYNGHVQPRVPLNDNYYDLVKDGVNTWKWQASLAKEYGVDGFSIYQYWFNGKQLMNKPMEILLEHEEIDINYCICWANESWTRTWYGLANQVLMEQTYGTEEDWKKHFDYNLQFFKDKRYIKINNKPLFQIYRSFDIEDLDKMLDCFNKWAKEAGFDGIHVLFGKTGWEAEKRNNLADGYYFFEPGYTLNHDFAKMSRISYKIRVAMISTINKIKKNKVLERYIPAKNILERIVDRKYEKNDCPCIFPDWDNTPRRSHKGLVYKGTSPEYFRNCLKKLINNNPEIVFINAWNEWGEGAYLEPDTYRRYAYLEAIKECRK